MLVLLSPWLLAGGLLPFAGQSGRAQTAEMAATLPESPLPSRAYDPKTSSSETGAPAQTAVVPQVTPPPPPPDETEAQKSDRERADEQVRRQEKQRTLGVVPSFNIVYDKNVPPLTPKQKIHIAFHSATDPVTFVVAGLNAAYDQATDGFPGYGQGAAGYGKRFGAAYADSFDGTMIGNAFFPILMKEDPRYFRMGTGTFRKRFLYSLSTTVWCRRDSGTMGPNYANVLGNLAAGGIANLYYPASDRGAGLTFERGLVVTAEGALGGLSNEFLPDLTRHFLHRDISGKRVPAATPAPSELCGCER